MGQRECDQDCVAELGQADTGLAAAESDESVVSTGVQGTDGCIAADCDGMVVGAAEREEGFADWNQRGVGKFDRGQCVVLRRRQCVAGKGRQRRSAGGLEDGRCDGTGAGADRVCGGEDGGDTNLGDDYGAGWKDEELLYDAAVNGYSCPGWSFYKHSADPAKHAAVQRALKKNTAPYWAATEWLLMKPAKTEVWRSAIENTLADQKCRFVCIYNWEGIRGKAPVLQAIREVSGSKGSR